MAISDPDYKILWGRAGGICSNPGCRDDLTTTLKNDTTYNVGEMAHIIARSPNGRRGLPGGGSDGYENLILLCPTCHTKIDKAPEGTYPESLLHQWKDEHESEIRKFGSVQKFKTLSDLKVFVSGILTENHAIWKQFGPQSVTAVSDPGSNLHHVWDLRKLDTVIPNNTKIITTIQTNAGLLPTEGVAVFLKFKIHAGAFEENQIQRIDNYPTFPADFATYFTP